ncbi:nucleoside hydrolase [Sphingomonas sp. DG1-23]|uniref:nucleoside hydrolase n=1 Tax=Sphingomonas sp. DG1-23 TaxID=3068316 RepID=UPI00273E74F9|nr:nucleoside hydrolase [Sphingomonas sp. DG1-23]MDP5278235.1 nucleoside hydrolase [Sphingomonas sp. DG1-23]
MSEVPSMPATVDTMTPLVFIHDAAIDDFVATLLIESMPQFDLKGVIIANADCVPQPGIEVASRVNQFMGRPDLPLGLSKARGWNPFPWPYRDDCIRLGGIPILAPFQSNVPTPPPSGDDLLAGMLEAAIETGTPLTVLLTTGFTPLTEVLAARPELAQGIGQIAWMGGALDVKGNLDPSTIDPTIANPHAEWNVFWDPFAADEALANLGEIAVFPLDITDTAAVTPALMATLQAQGAQYSFSQFAFEAYGLVSDEPFYDMWNVTSTVWLDAPELYAAPRRTPLQVVQWGFEQGWLQPAPPGSGRPSHNVYLSFADQPGFYDYVTTRLARSA